MQRSVTRLGVGIHQDKLFARPWRSLRLCEKSVLCSSHGLSVEAGNQISRKSAKIAKVSQSLHLRIPRNRSAGRRKRIVLQRRGWQIDVRGGQWERVFSAWRPKALFAVPSAWFLVAAGWRCKPFPVGCPAGANYTIRAAM